MTLSDLNGSISSGFDRYFNLKHMDNGHTWYLSCIFLHFWQSEDKKYHSESGNSHYSSRFSLCWKKEVLRAYTNPSASFSGKQAFMLVESIECLYTKKSETQEICLVFSPKTNWDQCYDCNLMILFKWSLIKYLSIFKMFLSWKVESLQRTETD